MVFWVALLTWLSAPISYLSRGQVGHYRLVTSALYVDPFYQTDWAFVLNNNGFWCIIYRYHPHVRQCLESFQKPGAGMNTGKSHDIIEGVYNRVME